MVNEDALRAMIRESIARRLGGAQQSPDGPSPALLANHPSHGRYTLPASGGPCLIEPAVACNHCGYCQSHGF